MRFLADMGISQSTVLWLRQNGHDAIHLRKSRIVLTCDLDFGDLMAEAVRSSPIVIIFRLDDEKRVFVLPDELAETNPLS